VKFLIGDTFTDSLARLTGEEQKAAKMTAFDLQMDPTGNGLSFHRLERAKDRNFWSVRVNGDVRLIVHRTDASLLLCYVDHHDSAYAWAERRRLETHPKTGAAQLVEVRETVREVVVPVITHQTAKAPQQRPLFGHLDDEQLLEYGVPGDWVPEVKAVDEDGLLRLAGHLPAEAAEALLELATGGLPKRAVPAGEEKTPFTHPDAQRRFRVVTSVEELQTALDSPWDRWLVFLHPEQRRWIERSYAGPARVSGSAGTGKTVVALHRAVHLARQHKDARVLLATFSDPLANALRAKVRRLVGNEPRLAERLDVYALGRLAVRLHEARVGPVRLATREQVSAALEAAAADIRGHRFGPHFLRTEWEQVVDAWQLESWEAYRDVPRLGRRTRLPEKQREVLWDIFSRVRTRLAELKVSTEASVFSRLATALAAGGAPPYEYSVVDEAQDVGIAQLRFFAALGGGCPNALFFAGDLGQRIFQQPFSWKACGVDIRGRSRTLRVNYRTSHQIRAQADKLLNAVVTDVDGEQEDRSHTVSVFNGPTPVLRVCQSASEETSVVSAWLADRLREGLHPHEVAIFVRSPQELDRAEAAARAADLPYAVFDERVDVVSGRAAVGTMHLAKGLEFRAVAVMACDDEVLPSQARMEEVGDQGDLREVYDTERHLLYVACTRARDYLSITGVKPASEFLSDFS
jgi:hypothetical protein